MKTTKIKTGLVSAAVSDKELDALNDRKVLFPEKLEKANEILNKSGLPKKSNGSGVDLEKILLDGPVATKDQLNIVQKNRKAINQWSQAS
jgi:hypothetical protein